MMSSSANPTWQPSFEISHVSRTNGSEEEDVLSVCSACSQESSHRSISTHHSTYTDPYPVSEPWYKMNKRTMTASLIMMSVTTSMFAYMESLQMKSFSGLQASPIVFSQQGGQQQSWAVGSQEEADLARPQARALVRPHSENAVMEGLLPNQPQENNIDSNGAAAEVQIEIPQDNGSYLTPPSLSQSNIDMLSEPIDPAMVPPLAGFSDVWDPYAPAGLDVPMFWHIPKSGGSTVKDIIADCHGKIVANENGVADGHDQDTELQVVNINGNGQVKFVNVDTTTEAGLQHAIELGLIQSNLAELIISPFLYEAEPLFGNDVNDPALQAPHGRLFATFRHPIERAVSLFNYLKYADWETTYNDKVRDMTLEEYAQSSLMEDNWMTRRLVGLGDGDEITGKHLQVAMDIMRRKFLVGLTNDMDASVDRFERYFQWKYTLNPTQQETCRESLVSIGTNANRNQVVVPPEGTREYNLLLERNLFDVEIYKYAELLFEEQGAFVSGVPEGFRLIDATCSKCDEEEDLQRESHFILEAQDAGQMLSRRLRG